jgi:RES domain-containing protein
VKAWRLARRRYAELDGEGANRYGGRWNFRGQAVVYAAEHLSLAVLEALVHLEFAPEWFPPDYVKIEIHISDEVAIQRLDTLPPTDDEIRQRGAAWYDANATVVLLVPSVVVPEEFNLLINPGHKDFSKVIPTDVKPFKFDPRFTRLM